jgi:hypothetical protein
VQAIAGYLGLLGPKVAVNAQTRTYTNAQGQQVPLPIPASDKIVAGGQGRVWYTDQGGQHLLTSGVGPAIDPTTNGPASSSSASSSPAVIKQSNSQTQTSTGAGGESWQSRMRQRAKTYTPQYGDNMNEVAAKLGLKGGWQAFGVPSFEHGVPINIPSPPPMPAMPAMPGIQQSAGGQSVEMPGISVHQSEQGQSVQVNGQQIGQQVRP